MPADKGSPKPKKMTMREVLMMPPTNGSVFDELKDSEVVDRCVDRAEQALEYIAPQHRQMKRSYRLHSDNCWRDSAFARRINAGRPTMVANILVPMRDKILGEHLMQNFAVDVVPRDEAGADFSTLATERQERVFNGLNGEKFNEAQFLTGLVNGIFSRGDTAMHFNQVMRMTLDAGWGGYLRMYTDYLDRLNEVMDIRFSSNRDAWSWLMDPECREPDFSDMNFFMDAQIMTKKEAQSVYGKYPSLDENRSLWDSGMSREASNYLHHKNDKLVKIVEYFDRRKKAVTFVKVRNNDGSVGFVKADEWQHIQDEETAMGNYAEGDVKNDFWQVTKYVIAGDSVIRKGEVMPEWDEIPIFPMCGMSFLDKRGRVRYRGVLDPAEDLQHLLNYNYSAWAEIQAKASKTAYQVVGPGGHEDEVDRIRQALMNNELVVPVKAEIRPMAQPEVDKNLVGMINVLPNIMREVIGISEAALGQRTNETSERGIQARKAESDVGMRVFAYQAKLVIRRMARMCVKALPIVYDGTRQVVIVAKDGERTPVRINTAQDVLDEETGTTVEKLDNDVTQPANVDYIVKSVIKESDSRQDEAVKNMIEIVKTTGQGQMVMPLVLKMMLENVGGPGAGSVIRKLTDTLIPDDALTDEEVARKYEKLARVQKTVAQLKQQHQYQDPPPPPEIQKLQLEVQKAQFDVQIAQATLNNRQADAQIDGQAKSLDLQKKQLEISGVEAANQGKVVASQKVLADVAKAQQELRLAREQADNKMRELRAKASQDKETIKAEILADLAEKLAELFDNPEFAETIRNTIKDNE